MENSKLVRLLRTLSPSEVKGFDAYLRAFHAGEEVPIALFGHLRPFYPAFKAKELDKGRIEQELGLAQTEKHKRVSNEASKLYAWLLNFLAWEKFRSEEHKPERYFMAMEALREKKLEQEFFSLAKRTSAWLDKTPASAWKPLHYMRLAHYKYYYTPTQKWKTDNGGIEEAAAQLHHFFNTANLKYLCELRSRARALQEEKGTVERYKLPDAVHSGQVFMLARLYGLCEKMLEKDDDEHFDDFYKAFESNKAPLGKEDEHVLLTYLMNAIARRLPRDQERWAPQAFRLYQRALEKGLLITDGYLSDLTFHNIIQLACGVHDLPWAEQFIEKYAGFLVEEGRDSTIALARARIAFEQADFEQPLELLSGIEFKDHSFSLQAKLIQVRCFYELEEAEALDSFIKSFGLFLLRNKVVNKQGALKAYQNFLKVLKMMAGPKPSRRKIEAEMEKYDQLVCKSWLKSQLESLPE